jgi:hypothetical protein
MRLTSMECEMEKEVEIQEFLNIRKNVSMHSIFVINAISRVSKSNPNKPIRMADIARITGEPHQSSITKIVSTLNEKFVSAFKEPIFNITDDKIYTETNVGRAFINKIESFDREFVDAERDLLSLSKVPTVGFAINSFSYRTLINLEKKTFKKLGREYDKKIYDMRSHEIFDAVKHNTLIDFGVVESAIPVLSGRQIEAKKISSRKIRIYTNNSDLKLMGENIDIETLAKSKLLLCNSNSFYEYLLRLVGLESANIRAMTQEMKRHIVEKEYNVYDTVSSVNLLIDMLFLSDEKFICLATQEVSQLIEAVINNWYSRGFRNSINNAGQVRRFDIEDGGILLSKYIIRKANSYHSDSSDIRESMWLNAPDKP